MGQLDSTPKEVMSERRSIATRFGGKKGPLSEKVKEEERKLTAVGWRGAVIHQMLLWNCVMGEVSDCIIVGGVRVGILRMWTGCLEERGREESIYTHKSLSFLLESTWARVWV
jgi:hypothetical protein